MTHGVTQQDIIKMSNESGGLVRQRIPLLLLLLVRLLLLLVVVVSIEAKPFCYLFFVTSIIKKGSTQVGGIYNVTREGGCQRDCRHSLTTTTTMSFNKRERVWW